MPRPTLPHLALTTPAVPLTILHSMFNAAAVRSWVIPRTVLLPTVLLRCAVWLLPLTTMIPKTAHEIALNFAAAAARSFFSVVFSPWTEDGGVESEDRRGDGGGNRAGGDEGGTPPGTERLERDPSRKAEGVREGKRGEERDTETGVGGEGESYDTRVTVNGAVPLYPSFFLFFIFPCFLPFCSSFSSFSPCLCGQIFFCFSSCVTYGRRGTDPLGLSLLYFPPEEKLERRVRTSV